ncbi:MAG: OmpA family protein [Paramuribaculum sp.]|nr:OmpA family protein [Paramuribaculum sp.]
MTNKSILRIVLVVGLLIVGGSAMSAQGIVPPPSKPATSTQRGKTNTNPTRPCVHQEKKMYSYSEFVNSDFGKWVSERNVLPFVITADKNGKISNRDRLDLMYLSNLINVGLINYITLVGIKASDSFKGEVVDLLVEFESARDKINPMGNWDEFSNFIPGPATQMIVFQTMSDFRQSPIMFGENSSALTDEAKLQLYIIGKNMNSREKEWYVEGFTNGDTGSASSHYAISQKRAEAVANFLVDECRVRQDKLTIMSYGDETQIFPKSEWNNVVLFDEK